MHALPFFRKITAIIGYLISGLLALQPFLAETDTCTQGAPDGFGAAIFATTIITVFSLACTGQAVPLKSRIHLLGVFHILTFVLFCYKLAPAFVLTNLQGIHICGGEFGYASDPEEFLYAPVLSLALISILMISGIGIQKWCGKRNATVPPEK